MTRKSRKKTQEGTHPELENLVKYLKASQMGPDELMKLLNPSGTTGFPDSPLKPANPKATDSGSRKNTKKIRKEQAEARSEVPKAGKVRYSDGLGWNHKTQSWWAHRRIGKRTFTRDTGKRDKRDAEAWLANFIVEIELDDSADFIPGLTVSKGLEIWRSEAPLGLGKGHTPSPFHISCVTRRWRRWVLPTLGNIQVEKLSRGQLEALIRHYADTPGPRGAHRPSGVRNFMVELFLPLRWLKNHGKVRRIPDLPQTPSIKPGLPVIIPFDRVNLLLDRFDQLVNYDLYPRVYIRIMAFTGLRTGTARNLSKESFKEEFTKFDTGITKNGVAYLLPVPSKLRTLLERIPGIREPGPLFPSSFSAKGRGENWCRGAFKEAARDVGMTHSVAWHRLRATYATLLARAGVDVFVLMEAMGWKTLAVALRYIRTAFEDVEKGQLAALDILDRF